MSASSKLSFGTGEAAILRSKASWPMGSWHPRGGLARFVPPCGLSMALRIPAICPAGKGFGKTVLPLPPKFPPTSDRSAVA